ncbi:MAG: hypothetical protein NTZ85_01350, partial [Bacteroidia bacterium]|nr:hypothetical protein [Bacteroidia bacterium]
MKKLLILLASTMILTNLVAQEKPELILPVGHMGNVNTVCFSGDGKYVLTSSTDHTAKIWDAHRGRLLHNLEGHTDEVYSAVFSSDGNRVITLSRDKTLKIWNVVTGELIYTSPATIDGAILSHDGKIILTSSITGSGDSVNVSYSFWDIQKEKLTLLYNFKSAPDRAYLYFALSPDN